MFPHTSGSCCCISYCNPLLKQSCAASNHWGLSVLLWSFDHEIRSLQLSGQCALQSTDLNTHGAQNTVYCRLHSWGFFHSNTYISSGYLCTFVCNCAMNLTINWQMAPPHKVLPWPSCSPHIFISVMDACHSSVGRSLRLATVRIWLYSSSRGMCIDFKPLEIHSSAKWP